MPKATMEQGSDFALDEDTPYKAQLLEVVEKVTKGGISRRTNKPYEGFSSWIWKFEVTEGEKLGQWCWADTEDSLTTATGNKVRVFGEALRGQPYELGEGIDTDDLVGMECYIEVGNETYTKADGSTGFKVPVINAFPLVGGDDGGASVANPGNDPWASGSEEPPF